MKLGGCACDFVRSYRELEGGSVWLLHFDDFLLRVGKLNFSGTKTLGKVFGIV